MRTNIEIDDALMAEAMAELGVSTKKEAVETGLRTALQLRRQAAAIDQLWGIGWDGDLEAMRMDKPRSQDG